MGSCPSVVSPLGEPTELSNTSVFGFGGSTSGSAASAGTAAPDSTLPVASGWGELLAGVVAGGPVGVGGSGRGADGCVDGGAVGCVGAVFPPIGVLGMLDAGCGSAELFCATATTVKNNKKKANADGERFMTNPVGCSQQQLRWPTPGNRL